MSAPRKPQFTAEPFARGVRLAVQHFDTLTTIQTAASEAAITRSQEDQGRGDHLWVIPWIGAESAQAGLPVAILPFTVPPFQQKFAGQLDALTTERVLSDPQYPIMLTELSLSFDQRAEPYAIVGPLSKSGAGQLTAADMTRYDMTLRLLERQPSLLTGENLLSSEVLNLVLPGVELFGGVTFRANPLLVQGLAVPLKPFAIYIWELSCPGLYSAAGVDPGATVEQLALVSLTIKPTLQSPLLPRDKAGDFNVGPGIQNIPTTHAGVQVGTTIPLTVPAGGASMLGRTVQSDLLGGFDLALRKRLDSGYGTDFGALGNVMQSADVSPHAMLNNDSHYQMIVVPMFGGQVRNSVRAEDVAGAGLPFCTPSSLWKDPAFDARVIPVPDNFVLHHAFAVWNNYSPPADIVFVADVWTSTVAGAPVAGNTARLTIGATNYDYPMVGGDTLAMIAIAVAAAAAADPLYNVYASGVLVLCVAKTATTAVIASSFLAGAGTFLAAHTRVGASRAGWGKRSASADYVQAIGIDIHSGMGSDGYAQQQVAYLSWAADNAAPWTLDQYDPGGNPGYNLMQIPLVNDVVPWTDHSWFSSGLPFFMGRGNSNTQPRSQVGVMPTAFGGAGFVWPSATTAGGETNLEVRWSKVNAASGLAFGGDPDDVVVGAGGEFVLLVGKCTVAG